MSVFDSLTNILETSCLSAFEESEGVPFTPRGGAVVTVRAIFDREALVAESGGEFGVSTYKPLISFSRAEFIDLDLAAPSQGDKVTIDGVVYEVVEPQHDGRSEYRAILAKV